MMEELKYFYKRWYMYNKYGISPSTLKLIILVIIILSLVFILYKIIDKLLSDYIKKTSVRYNAIIKLNKEYFFRNINEVYLIKEKLKSKRAVYSYNFSKRLLNAVLNDGAYYKRLCDDVNYNRELLDKYLQEYEFLPEYSDYRGKFFSFIHKRKEVKMCEMIKLKPIISPIIRIKVSYISPAGRNYYENKHDYGCADVISYIQLAKKQIECENTKQYQRKLMTNSLRYEILKRDGFRCKICGRTAEDGVKLHVDHILPVAKGGKTVRSNLRTLCDECNSGKSDKYDEYGIN